MPKISKDKSSIRQFYCLDANANAKRLETIASIAFVSSCSDSAKSSNENCLEAAKNKYCKSLKGDKPLYGSLSEVPNKTTCTEFADKILSNRGLGSLTKPGPSVSTQVPVVNSDSCQTTFQVNIARASKSAIYASSSVAKAIKQETWTLTVAGT